MFLFLCNCLSTTLLVCTYPFTTPSYLPPHQLTFSILPVYHKTHLHINSLLTHYQQTLPHSIPSTSSFTYYCYFSAALLSYTNTYHYYTNTTPFIIFYYTSITSLLLMPYSLTFAHNISHILPFTCILLLFFFLFPYHQNRHLIYTHFLHLLTLVTHYNSFTSPLKPPLPYPICLQFITLLLPATAHPHFCPFQYILPYISLQHYLIVTFPLLFITLSFHKYHTYT